MLFHLVLHYSLNAKTYFPSRRPLHPDPCFCQGADVRTLAPCLMIGPRPSFCVTQLGYSQHYGRLLVIHPSTSPNLGVPNWEGLGFRVLGTTQIHLRIEGSKFGFSASICSGFGLRVEGFRQPYNKQANFSGQTKVLRIWQVNLINPAAFKMGFQGKQSKSLNPKP